jgi:hypothetical protein
LMLSRALQEAPDIDRGDNCGHRLQNVTKEHAEPPECQ